MIRNGAQAQEFYILAAGQGKRMRSVLPKVLQPIAGKPMLGHVLDAARTLDARRICVVYGHGGEVVRERLDAPDLAWARQAPQLGTGHAVQQALPHLTDGDMALVLYGDVPLIGVPTLRRLVAAAGNERLALLTVEMDNPTGYGRILRDAAGHVTRIVEEKDASDDERSVREVNTGILVAPVAACATGSAASATTTPRASTTSPTSSGWRSPMASRSSPCSPTRCGKPSASIASASSPSSSGSTSATSPAA